MGCQFAQPAGPHLRPQVVGLEERRAVAADRQLDQPRACTIGKGGVITPYPNPSTAAWSCYAESMGAAQTTGGACILPQPVRRRAPASMGLPQIVPQQNTGGRAGALRKPSARGAREGSTGAGREKRTGRMARDEVGEVVGHAPEHGPLKAAPRLVCAGVRGTSWDLRAHDESGPTCQPPHCLGAGCFW